MHSKIRINLFYFKLMFQPFLTELTFELGYFFLQSKSFFGIRFFFCHFRP